ncbi:MAG: histidine phosphatase family protein [Spirochaetaceae bacterium]
MTELCLIRHGETDWNLRGLTQGSTDIPLNDLGREQARITGAYLAQSPWDAVYSSDLGRAYETAAIISKSLGLTSIAQDPRLRERGFGEAEGLNVTERKSRYIDSSSIPESEPWDSVRLRGLAAIEQIALENPEKRVLVVSHGGVIMTILSHLSGGELMLGRPPLKNLSMSLLRYSESWEIEFHNRVAPELEDEAVSA